MDMDAWNGLAETFDIPVVVTPEDVEALEERAAIIEHEGNKARIDAEIEALRGLL